MSDQRPLLAQVQEVLDYLNQPQLRVPVIRESNVRSSSDATIPERDRVEPPRSAVEPSPGAVVLAPAKLVDPELDALFVDIDDRAHYVEMRGNRTWRGVYFDAPHVANAFAFDLRIITQRKSLRFEQGRHYVLFKTETSAKRTFLTAAGLLKVCADEMGAANWKAFIYLLRLEHKETGLVLHQYGRSVNLLEKIKACKKEFSLYGFTVELVGTELVDGDKAVKSEGRIRFLVKHHNWHCIAPPLSGKLCKLNCEGVRLVLEIMAYLHEENCTTQGGAKTTMYSVPRVSKLLLTLFPKSEPEEPAQQDESEVICFQDARSSMTLAPEPTPALEPMSAAPEPTPVVLEPMSATPEPTPVVLEPTPVAPEPRPEVPVPTPSRRMPAGRHRSAIWKHFVEAGPHRARCMHCSWSTSANAGRMRHHISTQCPGYSGLDDGVEAARTQIFPVLSDHGHDG